MNTQTIKEIIEKLKLLPLILQVVQQLPIKLVWFVTYCVASGKVIPTNAADRTSVYISIPVPRK